MASKRIHTPKGDKFVQTPFVRTETGEILPYPISNTKTVSAATIKKFNFPIVKSQAIEKIYSQFNNNQMLPTRRNFSANPDSVAIGETSAGKKQALRLEKPEVDGSQYETITISLDNTTGTTPILENVVLFDDLTLIAANKGITAATQFANMTIGGTYGEASALTFKAISGKIPLDLHEMHVEASSANFFTQGYIKTAYAKVNSDSPNERTVSFAMEVDGKTYNPLIRKARDFRFQANGLSGIYVQIPAGMTVSFTFKLRAQGDAAGMTER